MHHLESKIAFDPRAPEKAKSKLHQKTMATKDTCRALGFCGHRFTEKKPHHCREAGEIFP